MLGYAADRLRVKWFPAGAYIIEQDAEDRNLYLVLSGEVEIISEQSDGTLSQLARVGAGQFIGETAIAEDGRRNAHCIAATDTTCFVLSPHDADDGYRADPQEPTPALAPVIAVGAEAGRPLTEDDLEPKDEDNLVVSDVRSVVPDKVRALAAHSTQYAVAPGLFPDSMMTALLGTEYFAEVDYKQG